MFRVKCFPYDRNRKVPFAIAAGYLRRPLPDNRISLRADFLRRSLQILRAIFRREAERRARICHHGGASRVRRPVVGSFEAGTRAAEGASAAAFRSATEVRRAGVV